MGDSTADGQSAPKEGLREVKRRQTRSRIIDAGLRLFLEQGYEATTIDAIAEDARISRRSFYSYFKSKDDLLMAWQDGAWQTIWEVLSRESPAQAPLEAVRWAFLSSAADYQWDTMLVIDRVMRSTESLHARKQLAHADKELELYAVLRTIWPGEERRVALRLVAMVSIGAFRLALDDWSEDGGGQPFAGYVSRGSGAIAGELPPPL